MLGVGLITLVLIIRIRITMLHTTTARRTPLQEARMTTRACKMATAQTVQELNSHSDDAVAVHGQAKHQASSTDEQDPAGLLCF